MSCFQGLMREYTSVSLDRFDGRNLSSTVFFLSHCHKDHMVGLDSPRFHQKLQSRMDVFLYCSAVTQTLLLSDPQYMHLRKFIKILDVSVQTTVTIPDKGGDVKKMSTVLVTPLGAGHCPGSLMFLFEGPEGTCLYTGDFRWETDYARTQQAFKSGDSVKEIKSLYIDTTFCFEEAFHFPSRNDCAKAACELVSHWLAQSADHVVSISCKSKYGHEHFLKELSTNTHQKVHTSKQKCDVYQQIGDLDQVFTSDPAARIHSCTFVHGRSPQSRLPCGYIPEHGRDINVLVLRPSTMFFALNPHKHRNEDLIVYPKGSRGLHRVCYSFHSSYVEVRDLVRYLKPHRVFPNVIPPNEQDMSKVQARLNSFLQLVHLKHIPPMVAPDSVLGKLKVRGSVYHARDSSQSDSENLVFDSPVKIQPSSRLPQRQVTPSQTSLSSPKDSEASVVDSEASVVDSSYEGSIIQDEGMDLTNTQDTGKEKPSLPLSSQELFGAKAGEDKAEDLTLDNTEESYCLYVSGDEDCDEEDRVSTVSYCAHDDVVVIESSLSQEDVCEIDVHDGAAGSAGDGLLHGQGDSSSHQGDGDTSHGPRDGVSHGETCDGKGDKVTLIRADEDEEDDLEIKDDIAVDSGDGKGPKKKDGISQKKGDNVSQGNGDKVSILQGNGDTVSISQRNRDKVSSNKRDGQTKKKSVFEKQSSCDLFDEGNATDIEDNVEEDVGETQRFDVDFSSDTDIPGLKQTHTDKPRKNKACTAKACTDKPHTNIGRLKEDAVDRGSGMRLPILPPSTMEESVEEIVILDSDDESDKESGFLSGGKDCVMSKFNNKRRMPMSINSAEYARNLSNLVAKVEKRLASSDSDISPRKKMRPDLSRNCESDSDATLPPSQGSCGALFPRSLYYTDSESESDSDSEAVEILYETDANGDRFDVLGNLMPTQPSLMTVCVKTLNRPQVSSTTRCIDDGSNSSDVIDLTEEPEDEDCADRSHDNSDGKVGSDHDKVERSDDEKESSHDKVEAGNDKQDKVDRSHDKQDKVDSSHDKQDKVDSSNDKQDKVDRSHDKQDKVDSSHDKQDKVDRSNDKQDKVDSSHDKQDKVDRSHDKQDKVDRSHDKMEIGDEEVETGLDKVDKSHDKQDKVDSSHDKMEIDDEEVETGLDKVDRSHDKVETGQDKVDTSDDKVESGNDHVEIRTDGVESSNDKVENNSTE
ncbi:protein artemis-like isoform X1 [Haliotis rufescens]|uniref:protein artemis-like isoform X1 n=1 Tax=Haliotis rufescens TaxID=6454 RepID=UPI00201EA29E|nr:protein artemis-like isoform X1 [Haliotis rufescens]